MRGSLLFGGIIMVEAPNAKPELKPHLQMETQFFVGAVFLLPAIQRGSRRSMLKLDFPKAEGSQDLNELFWNMRERGVLEVKD